MLLTDCSFGRILISGWTTVMLRLQSTKLRIRSSQIIRLSIYAVFTFRCKDISETVASKYQHDSFRTYISNLGSGPRKFVIVPLRKITNDSTTMRAWRRSLLAIAPNPSRTIYARCYSAKATDDPTTHFGFRTIPAEQKEQLGWPLNDFTV